MSENTEERALSLSEAAEKLGMSYQTIFTHRKEIGFRLPGSRIWRIWPSDLVALTKKCNNVTRLSLRVVSGEQQCLSENIPTPASGGSIYARQTAKELDELLAQRTRKQRRNTMTA